MNNKYFLFIKLRLYWNQNSVIFLDNYDDGKFNKLIELNLFYTRKTNNSIVLEGIQEEALTSTSIGIELASPN